MGVVLAEEESGGSVEDGERIAADLPALFPDIDVVLGNDVEV